MTERTQRDRELLELWAEHGMPTDDTTRGYAVGMLIRQQQDLDTLRGALDQLLDRCRCDAGQMRMEVGA